MNCNADTGEGSLPQMETQPAPPFLSPSDEEHLRLLSIFHIVAGILFLVGGFFPIFHLVIGCMLVFHPASITRGHGQTPPVIIGYMFMGLALFLMLCSWTLGVLTLVSAGRIREKRSRMYSMVVAGLNCCVFPIGTALGVFTFIVLGRPSVRGAYAANEASSSSSLER
jgi:hypothetical protein